MFGTSKVSSKRSAVQTLMISILENAVAEEVDINIPEEAKGEAPAGNPLQIQGLFLRCPHYDSGSCPRQHVCLQLYYHWR